MPEISDSGSMEDLCPEFLRTEKIHRPQASLKPGTLDFKASTLPRDHRVRQRQYLNGYKDIGTI